jgi:hypothetical protein
LRDWNKSTNCCDNKSEFCGFCCKHCFIWRENRQQHFTATASVGTIQVNSEQNWRSFTSIRASFATTALAQNATFYVDATNNGCTSGTRIPVAVVVNTFANVVDEP